MLAIDDFGTGYASLAYLADYPVQVLKIDRRFVQGLPEAPHSADIIRAVTALARTLEVTVVAEGAERVEEVEALYALGVAR